MLQYIRRTIIILKGKDKFNPSTLFNPFEQKRMCKVFFKNIVYELFWRNWYNDPEDELRKVYGYAKDLESKLDKANKKIEELSHSAKWIRS